MSDFRRTKVYTCQRALGQNSFFSPNWQGIQYLWYTCNPETELTLSALNKFLMYKKFALTLSPLSKGLFYSLECSLLNYNKLTFTGDYLPWLLQAAFRGNLYFYLRTLLVEGVTILLSCTAPWPFISLKWSCFHLICLRTVLLMQGAACATLMNPRK